MPSNFQSDITRKLTIGRDTSETLTAEPASDATPSTVFVCLTRDLRNAIFPGVTASHGPTLREDQKESFKRYKEECGEASLSLAEDKSMSKFFRTSSIPTIIQTFQSRLNTITPSPPGSRVVVVDGQDISESWNKFANRVKSDRVCGHLVLSVKDPKAVSGATSSKGWFGSFKEAEITGCKIRNGRPSGPQRKEASRRLHDFGSRYLDLKNSNVWPSESVATELSNRPEHFACGVVTVSEAIFSLPGMFEDVVYTRGDVYSDQEQTSNDHAPANEDLIDFEEVSSAQTPATSANMDKTATTGPSTLDEGNLNADSWDTW
ncbi:hypothetical protein L486_04708 [Kwoniella mangroviensis CBS 10435]|uniref:Uncharacterized protein n=1 Tax=Kwoniella mangroviensis CBS 10435 TaxID=1331196 RepID=A0A1B9INV5_9TREE|nr:hypothetical protein L486_04708 [Kwoniella mangroviensis CBS 10435]